MPYSGVSLFLSLLEEAGTTWQLSWVVYQASTCALYVTRTMLEAKFRYFLRRLFRSQLRN